jgi:hypothetical protein
METLPVARKSQVLFDQVFDVNIFYFTVGRQWAFRLECAPELGEGCRSSPFGTTRLRCGLAHCTRQLFDELELFTQGKTFRRGYHFTITHLNLLRTILLGKQAVIKRYEPAVPPFCTPAISDI